MNWTRFITGWHDPRPAPGAAANADLPTAKQFVLLMSFDVFMSFLLCFFKDLLLFADSIACKYQTQETARVGGVGGDKKK